MPPLFQPSIVRLLTAPVVGLVDLLHRLLFSRYNKARGELHLPVTELCGFYDLCYRYRFRLVSISCDPNWKFSIDNHTMTIIEVEGTNVQPLVVDQIQIFAGQRYSFVVRICVWYFM